MSSATFVTPQAIPAAALDDILDSHNLAVMKMGEAVDAPLQLGQSKINAANSPMSDTLEYQGSQLARLLLLLECAAYSPRPCQI